LAAQTLLADTTQKLAKIRDEMLKQFPVYWAKFQNAGPQDKEKACACLCLIGYCPTAGPPAGICA
jgi:hypothetical protein